MLSPKTRWSVGTPDPARAKALSDALGIRPLLAALLASRGHTVEEAAFFLSDEGVFHDPFQLKGMREAVDRIREALARNERLLVYGDYDADGVSSASLLIRLFRSLDANLTYRIPHRVRDGYGLHTHLLEEAKNDGVSLVVTVDTGISALEAAEAAKSLWLDLIITDHHQPPETLPDALAVVNPKRSDCPYPFKGLAGVGVAFKLAQALLGRVPEELAEWAALGTVADLMPLVGENRSIVKLGLERLRREPPPGFAALLRVAGALPGEMSANTIGFGIAPRVNAVGRLDSADDAVRLLVTDDPVEADDIARRLDALNKERQRMVETAAAEAIAIVEARGGPEDGIVVASEAWNPGIIGIVASRLVETYYRPTVVIAIDPASGVGKGSARAIPGFHLYDALKTCEAMFDHFGGHESAAGLSLHRDSIERFAEAFRREAGSRLTPDMLVPVTNADAALSVKDITLEAIQELDKLAPFGMAHPAPVFAVRDAVVRSAAVIGKDRRHAKWKVTDGVRELDAVGFGIGDTVRRIAEGSRLSLIGELAVNEWNGRRTPQMIVKDVEVPHLQLFDWRDISSPAAFKERWEAAGFGEDARPAFLLGPDDEAPAALAPWWKLAPAYRLTAEGAPSALPINALARDRALGEATDWIVVSCPFPYERFHHILIQDTSLCRLYALSFGGRTQGASALDRDAMKRAYAVARTLPETGADEWIRAVAERATLDESAARRALRAFRELGFVAEGASPRAVRLVTSPGKRDLSESPTFAAESARAAARREWSDGSADALRRRLLGFAGESGRDAAASDRRREGFEQTEALG